MIYNSLLILHILSGSLALLSGLYSTLRKKGTPIHRKIGIVFSISMLVVAISAVILSSIKPSPFLFAIGFFTLYLTTSGWNWAARKTAPYRIKAAKIIGGIGILLGFSLIGLSLVDKSGLNYVLLVFGGIMVLLSLGDFRPAKDMKTHISRHISRIGGAYIAAVTAFLVVNVQFLPAYLIWLGPTVVGSILISVSTRTWLGRGVST